MDVEMTRTQRVIAWMGIVLGVVWASVAMLMAWKGIESPFDWFGGIFLLVVWGLLMIPGVILVIRGKGLLSEYSERGVRFVVGVGVTTILGLFFSHLLSLMLPAAGGIGVRVFFFGLVVAWFYCDLMVRLTGKMTGEVRARRVFVSRRVIGWVAVSFFVFLGQVSDWLELRVSVGGRWGDFIFGNGPVIGAVLFYFLGCWFFGRWRVRSAAGGERGGDHL